MDKKLIRKKDLLVILPIAAVALILWAVFLFSPKGSRAVIELSGESLKSFELSALSEEEIIELVGEDNIKVSIRISSEGAEFISSDCPDKTCVRTGKISKAGEAAVCLPARIAVRIEGEGGLDGVTY